MSWTRTLSLSCAAAMLAAAGTAGLQPASAATTTTTRPTTTTTTATPVTIRTDGTPVTVKADGAKEPKQARFAATGGQRIQVGCSTTPSTGLITLSLRAPDGSVFAGPSGCAFGVAFDVTTLPGTGTGTYTLETDVRSATGGTVTLTVRIVPPDQESAVTVNGGGASFSLRPGQQGRATFSGRAGQNVSVFCTKSGFTWPTFAGVRLTGPDGFQATSVACTTRTRQVTLPVAGSYTLTVDPWLDDTGTATIWVYDTPGTVRMPSGSYVTTSVALGPLDSATVVFEADAGQRLRVSCTDEDFAHGLGPVLEAPDGRRLAQPARCPAGTLWSGTAGLTGDYAITLKSSDDPVKAARVTVSRSGSTTTTTGPAPPTPGSEPVTTDGTAFTWPESGSVTFEGRAGQRIVAGCRLSGSGGTPNFTVTGPDGSVVGTESGCYTGPLSELLALPDTGLYTLSSRFSSGTHRTVELRIWTVPADATGTVTEDGGAARVSLSPGQVGRISFVNDGARSLDLRCDAAPDGSATAYYELFDPDGRSIERDLCGMSAYPSLGLVGTYTLVVDPVRDAAGAFDVFLFNTFRTVPVPTDGTPVAVPLAPLQFVDLTFHATAGQHLRVECSAATKPAYLVLYGPESFVVSPDSCSDGTPLYEGVAPETGEYVLGVASTADLPPGTFTARVTVSDTGTDTTTTTSEPATSEPTTTTSTTTPGGDA